MIDIRSLFSLRHFQQQYVVTKKKFSQPPILRHICLISETIRARARRQVLERVVDYSISVARRSFSDGTSHRLRDLADANQGTEQKSGKASCQCEWPAFAVHLDALRSAGASPFQMTFLRWFSSIYRCQIIQCARIGLSTPLHLVHISSFDFVGKWHNSVFLSLMFSEHSRWVFTWIVE